MELNQFSEKVRKGIEDFLGEGYTVELNRVTKNNGILLNGITIMEEENNISPNIYLENLFEEYKNGTSLGEIIKKVLLIYEENKIEGNVDMGFFLDYATVKKKIAYKLINYGDNEDLLKEVPFIRFLDMAVIFYCNIIHEMLGSATILIRNKECTMWGIPEQELFERAMENTPLLLRPEIRSIREMMEVLSENNELDSAGKEEMYVLTNDRQMFGASCILYPGLLEGFSKKIGSSFYILPSSIHEVILVPGNDLVKAEKFREMVREVNKTQVESDEILSDFVYYYDSEEAKIKRL